MKSAENFHSICRNMQNARDNIVDVDMDRQHLLGQIESLQEVSELRKQEIQTLNDSNAALQNELNDLKSAEGKSSTRQREMLFEIFKKVDRETCDALHEPTVEQLYKLVLSKMNGFLVRKHERRDEVELLEEQHRQELRYQR